DGSDRSRAELRAYDIDGSWDDPVTDDPDIAITTELKEEEAVPVGYAVNDGYQHLEGRIDRFLSEQWRGTWEEIINS
ncbi:MAG: hypothetical protein SVW77_00440, partial [Candidatus Nanohaloarchaea archaeon]|nr:hypothetical protein [Candidatus Nanohaloarchaea archaeon]